MSKIFETGERKMKTLVKVMMYLEAIMATAAAAGAGMTAVLLMMVCTWTNPRNALIVVLLELGLATICFAYGVATGWTRAKLYNLGSRALVEKTWRTYMTLLHGSLPLTVAIMVGDILMRVDRPFVNLQQCATSSAFVCWALGSAIALPISCFVRILLIRKIEKQGQRKAAVMFVARG